MKFSTLVTEGCYLLCGKLYIPTRFFRLHVLLPPFIENAVSILLIILNNSYLSVRLIYSFRDHEETCLSVLNEYFIISINTKVSKTGERNFPLFPYA